MVPNNVKLFGMDESVDDVDINSGLGHSKEYTFTLQL
jgi:hypothetical protein